MKHKYNVAFFAIGIACSIFILGYKSTPALIAVGATSFLIMCFGVVNIRWNYFFKSLNTWKTPDTLLTFDDGPDPILTPKVLDILHQHNVKAIFFLIGHKAEQHPDLVRKILQHGHLIGNHTYSHNNLMSLQMGSVVKEDLEKCQDVLKKITGQTVQLFRPPVGYTNPIIGRVIQQLNLRCVGWTIRSYDTVFKKDTQLIARLTKKSRPSAIVLLHDNLENTVRMLPEYIRQAREKGVIFVSNFSSKTR